MTEKASIRAMIRARFGGDEQRNIESMAICRHLLQWLPYRNAGCVALYAGLRREADVSMLIDDCLNTGKTLALPRVESDGIMTWRQINHVQQLVKGCYGIMEPAADTAVLAPDKLQLMIVPLEGIRHDGIRLGKGGGYYDRMLMKTHCPCVGTVLSWQWCDEIPRDDWDIPLDAAADCNGIHLFCSGSIGGKEETNADDQ